MTTLERHDDVFVLDLGDTENRFHPDWLAAVGAALDEVEQTDGPRALVTAATGKFFSNGLDLDWLGAHADAHEEYIRDVHALLARAVWDRGDAAAVDAVTVCVVRLPAALLFGEIRTGRVRPHTRAQLAAAVGAVLDCGPPH